MSDRERLDGLIRPHYLDDGDEFDFVEDPWIRNVFAVRVRQDGCTFDLIVNVENGDIDEVEFTSWPPECRW